MKEKNLDTLVQKYLQLKPLGEDTSSEYIPPEVENGLMIPAGKWFKVLFDRFKQAGQHVQIAGAEISLF